MDATIHPQGRPWNHAQCHANVRRGKWHGPADSSLTSSFPVSSAPLPLSPLTACIPIAGGPWRSIHALRSPPRMTSYGFFIQRRLFCIPPAFGTLFSWSFIVRYTRRHEYLIDSPIPSRYVPLLFALLFIDYIGRLLLCVPIAVVSLTRMCFLSSTLFLNEEIVISLWNVFAITSTLNVSRKRKITEIT